jgi:excisionase family DNA binding protein
MTMIAPPESSMTMTVVEAASQLRISKAQAYVLANQGRLPVVFVGTRRRVLRRALEEAIASGALDTTQGGTNR